MKHYAGLDVSNAETSICIVDNEGNFVKEVKVESCPEAIDRYPRKQPLELEKIGLEAGGLSHWLVSGLRARGWQGVVCIDSHLMATILAVNVNKTDRNDARAIANAIRCNNYKEVHIKSIESVKTNALLTSRHALVKQKTHLYGVLRGVLKTFGLKLGKGNESPRKAIKETLRLEEISPDEHKLSKHVDWSVIETVLCCYENAHEQLKILDKKLELLAKQDKVARCLMTHPGVGVVTAMAFKAEIDDPARFKKSRSVGAYFGMAPKQYSSGEIIKQGRISKNGSKEVRALLHEAGVVLLTRTPKQDSKLKRWGLKKRQKLKLQKASMAVGRKIAINLHRMWLENRDFDPQLDAEEFYHEAKSTRGKRKNASKV